MWERRQRKEDGDDVEEDMLIDDVDSAEENGNRYVNGKWYGAVDTSSAA